MLQLFSYDMTQVADLQLEAVPQASHMLVKERPVSDLPKF